MCSANKKMKSKRRIIAIKYTCTCGNKHFVFPLPDESILPEQKVVICAYDAYQMMRIFIWNDDESYKAFLKIKGELIKK